MHAHAGTFSLEGRQKVCQALVGEGKATWLCTDQTVCLVTVQSLQQWADKIVGIVKDRFTTNIMSVDEIYSGEDSRGTGAFSLLHIVSDIGCSAIHTFHST